MIHQLDCYTKAIAGIIQRFVIEIWCEIELVQHVKKGEKTIQRVVSEKFFFVCEMHHQRNYKEYTQNSSCENPQTKRKKFDFYH